MRPVHALCFALLLCAARHLAAQAPPAEDLINPDRPGLADGSAVVGRARFQIEAGFQQEFRRDGPDRDHTFFIPTLLRLGLTRRLEARVESNTFIHDSAITPGGTDRASGFAPVSLGLKYQFQEAKGTTVPSLGVIARVFPASGANGFNTSHVTGDIRLAADWNFADHFSLNPNVGVARAEDGSGRTFAAALFAMTFNYQPTSHLNPFLDIGLQAPEESGGRTAITFDGGIAWIVGSNVQLDASVGVGAHGQTPPHPFLAIGISFRSKAR